jgi:diguanylate cyclase (GGDEF)-like protein/PAS domain S-box-containing protein
VKNHQKSIKSSYLIPLILVSVMVYANYYEGYLLFHSLAEIFAIFVAMMMSVVVLHTHKYLNNHFLLYLGIGYFWIGILDLLHMLTFPGMNIFVIQSTNETLTFWIFTRFLEVVTLLSAPLFLVRKVRIEITFVSFMLITTVISYLGMSNYPFLEMFIADTGLTSLKVFSEYFIIVLLIGALFVYQYHRRLLAQKLYYYMILSIVFTIFAEFSFTLYTDIHGTIILIGHIFKLLSFWMIYLAVIETSLKRPFSTMARVSTTYDAIPNPVVIVNRSGKIVQVNQASIDFVDLKLDRIIGAEVHTLFHEQKDPKECELCFYIRHGAKLDHKEVEIRKDRFYQFSLTPILFDEEVHATIQVVTDVSVFRRAENRSVEQSKLSHTIINSIPDLIFYKDANENYLGCNSAFERFCGIKEGQLIGHDDYLLFDAQTAAFFQEQDKKMLALQHSRRNEEWVTYPNGKRVLLDTLKTSFQNSKGEAAGILGISRDITQMHRINEKLSLYKEVFVNTIDGIVITDSEGIIIEVNNAFCEVTQYSREEVIGNNPSFLSSGRQDLRFYEEMWSSLTNRKKWQGELWNMRKDGTVYPEWLNISMITDSDGEILHYIGAFSDITLIKETQSALQHMAYHDSLTQLPNRKMVRNHLKESIARMKRNQTIGAVLFLDLDKFKYVNDTFGHEVGDKLLIEVTTRLLGEIREVDMLGRIGGDEFIVLTEEHHCVETIEVLAQKLLTILIKPFENINAENIHIGCSIGVSFFPNDGKDPSELIRQADLAMYQAKEGGRNQVILFDEKMDHNSYDRIIKENALRRALDRGEFRLYYQPQVDILNKKVIGVEALIRWKHPEFGLVPPNEFISLCEELKLIIPMGKWIIKEASRQLLVWRNAGIMVEKMSINLSGVQIVQADFIEEVLSIFKENSCDPTLIEFEITETSLIKNLNQSSAVLEELKSHGFKFAIDDFGTGYSSLAYLKKLPFDTIKIDREFIIDLPSDQHDISIVQTVLSLAKDIGYKVVAEGAEEHQQVKFLEQRGCDIIQGYYFSKALSANDFEHFYYEKLGKI